MSDLVEILLSLIKGQGTVKSPLFVINRLDIKTFVGVEINFADRFCTRSEHLTLFGGASDIF